MAEPRVIRALLEKTQPAALGAPQAQELLVVSKSVPRLDSAAFIAPKRDRTPTWEIQREQQRDERMSRVIDYTQEAESPLAADSTLEQEIGDSEERGTPFVQRQSEDFVYDSSDHTEGETG